MYMFECVSEIKMITQSKDICCLWNYAVHLNIMDGDKVVVFLV